jgi:hypothetical protein
MRLSQWTKVGRPRSFFDRSTCKGSLRSKDEPLLLQRAVIVLTS